MKKPAQIPMSYSRRGGARLGAGRKKRKEGVAHEVRPRLSGREPVHVTLKVLEHVWNLRTRRCFEVLLAAFVAGSRRFGTRVVSLGIQGDHLHLLVEAASALALSRGIQGLTIRIAKGLDRLMGRRGRVFADRYHMRVLRTPAEVRAVMAYIAGNTAKHARQAGRLLPAGVRDPYTVGFFGERVLRPEGTAGMVAEPETWLLTHGWRRTAAPAPAPAHRPHRRCRRQASPQARALALLPGVGGLAGTAGPPAAGSSPAFEHRDRGASPAVPRAA